ncbi:MAG: sialate O-acetylesterase [Ruminococcaceae bacterium]|nr:sialate O-acetylesterase [Oscillospiraceae bacterium]
MKKLMTLLFSTLFVLIGLTTVSAADIQLPNLIGDHMLIQQAKPIKLWGTATPGETVTITLGTASKTISQGTATVKSDGTFQAQLPATMAGGPYTLTFSSPSSTKTVSDVLVGELWVQSGQSNMERATAGTGSFAKDILPTEQNNNIRIFMNTEAIKATAPATDLKGSWKIANKSTVNAYSAVGYVALETMQQELNMPVGGICNAVGGAGMSAFTGPVNGTAGDYYYAKTSPLTQMNIRGIMWYQGEGDRGRTPEQFTTVFNQLIQSWREDWKDLDLPFVYVALPPSPMKYYASWTGGYIMEDFSSARMGQLQSYYENDNVAMAISMDCPPNPGEDSLHPNNKKPIGQRLGWAALDMIYNVIDKGCSPLFKSVTVNGKTAVITFHHAYEGLKTTDGKAPRNFYVSESENGTYHEAVATITGKDTVTLTCDKVSAIKYVSYTVEKHMYPYTSADDAVVNTYADVNLVNSEGLPACPFAYAVTQTKPEKKPQHTVNQSTNFIAPLHEGFLMPDIEMINHNLSADDENAKSISPTMWSKTINTNKTGTTTLYGFSEHSDALITAVVTVKEMNEIPFAAIQATASETEVQMEVPVNESEATRSVYAMISFYDEQNNYLGTRMAEKTVLSDKTKTISLSAPIPSGAKKAKAMLLTSTLRPYLSVAEIELIK